MVKGEHVKKEKAKVNTLKLKWFYVIKFQLYIGGYVITFNGLNIYNNNHSTYLSKLNREH